MFTEIMTTSNSMSQDMGNGTMEPSMGGLIFLSFLFTIIIILVILTILDSIFSDDDSKRKEVKVSKPEPVKPIMQPTMPAINMQPREVMTVMNMPAPIKTVMPDEVKEYNYCPFCGTQLNRKVLYCPFCGQKLM
jgi:hypothetical protein